LYCNDNAKHNFIMWVMSRVILLQLNCREEEKGGGRPNMVTLQGQPQQTAEQRKVCYKSPNMGIGYSSWSALANS
jgi:hypothetical protein